MPIAHDLTTQATANSVTSLTFSHTVSGADRLLIVGVQTNGSNVTGVTYAGVAMTAVGQLTSGGVRVEMFRLIAPATGANSVVVSVAATTDIGAAASSYTGAHQTTPLGAAATASGTGTEPTVNVVAAVDDLVIDATGMVNAVLTAGPGQTQRANYSTGVDLLTGVMSTEPGAATVTMSWTGGTNDWAAIGVAMKPVAEAATAALDAGAWTIQRAPSHRVPVRVW